MKPATIIKIVLPVVAVVVIAWIVLENWEIIIGIKDPPPPPTNQEIEGISQDIDSLKVLPANKFCISMYEEIAYKIKDDQENKLLGENVSDNNRWAEILNKRLHAAYSSKFICQAWYVFKGNAWKVEDIKTIGSQTDKLIKSQYLEKGTATYDSLTQIQNILKEYNALTSFIGSCQRYSFTDDNLNSYFPDMSERINRSKKTLSYPVRNCSRIVEELGNIPSMLFMKHRVYLLDKINKYGPTYSDYDYYKNYQESVCDPLNNQIRDLNSRNYGRKADTCSNLLNRYKEDARKYF